MNLDQQLTFVNKFCGHIALEVGADLAEGKLPQELSGVELGRLIVAKATAACPATAPAGVALKLEDQTLTIDLPGLAPTEDGYPLGVDIDYWGPSPHLQVLCRNHGDPEGEPAVCVRYDTRGQVVEVLLTAEDILVKNESARDTPWELARATAPVELV